jgi:hypothetical protein
MVNDYDWIPTPDDFTTAAKRGITKTALIQRYRMGMDKERALTQLPRRKIDWGKWRTVGEQAGISYETLRRRVHNHGWSVEQAARTPLLQRNELKTMLGRG